MFLSQRKKKLSWFITCIVATLCPVSAVVPVVEFPARDPDVVVDKELDCGMRQLFWEKAQAAVPWRQDNQDIKEALQLCSSSSDKNTVSNSKKSKVSSDVDTQQKRRLKKQDLYGVQIHVCPKHGRDGHQEGNQTHPFRTLHRAVEAIRTHRQTTKTTDDKTNHNQALIILRQGIHFLKKTLVLTQKDSNITIRGHPEGTWISGGTLIPSKLSGWHPQQDNSNDNTTIWVADSVPSSITAITGLFTVNPHTRLTLARYPNANVEVWNAPHRYETIDSWNTKDEWLMPDYAGVPDFSDYINLADPHNPTGHAKDDSAMPDYNSYGTGKGGACATVWGDLPSYWCSNVSAGGWAFVDKAAAKAGRLNLPAGLLLASNSSFQQRVQKLWNKQQARGAIFHIAHSQGWAWHMFNVSHIINEDTNSTIAFDTGGWQGGRNWQCHNNKGLTDCNGANSDDKQLHGGPWYVEGVKEELDAPGEFYWDAASRKLYFYPPNCDKGTCQPPDLIASNLKTLFKIEGTQETPVRNIKFEGIRLRDAAKTIMEQWSAPSGGDWALYRGGAIHMEGTENITISDCQFRRLDGNAIMLGGYNRHAHVARSDFSWLGEGAMATWGDTNGYDATGGAQTRMSIIEHNVMSNLGLYQKQSSAWGQNKACQNIIRNNVMFNLPRAAINFNDGLGGGNLVEGNVIFNACRESGDHGPINSWDRMPFLSETTGVPSFSPLPTETRHNLIWANYGAAEGFDNDDGSSYYYTHHNAYYESDGFKMDYGGHSSNFTNNLVFSNGRKKCYGTASFKEGQGDIFANNTCIVARQNNDPPKLGQMFQCALYGMKPTFNRYYTNTGNGTFACGNQQALTLQAIQQQGYEVGSTLNPMPPATTILAWARDILKTTANHQIKRTKDDASY